MSEEDHTVKEDFEHFLSYSGFWREPEEVKKKLFTAFEAAWEPKKVVIGAERYYRMRQALTGIEYLASQEKPDMKLIFRAAHVAVCEDDHPRWKKWLDGLTSMLVRHGRVMEGFHDRPE